MMPMAVPIFLIALLLLAFAVGLRVLPLDFEQTGVQQATIAGSVVAGGWIMTFLLRELSDSISRERKSRDLQKALAAEISDYAATLHVDDPRYWKTSVEQDVMKGGYTLEDAFFPYFARISEPVIFNRIADDVSLLPENVIDSVIQFYSTLSDLRLFIEDVNSEDFRRLERSRRVVGYKDLTDLLTTTEEIANDAVLNLTRSLDGIPAWMVDGNGKPPHD